LSAADEIRTGYQSANRRERDKIADFSIEIADSTHAITLASTDLQMTVASD
jgi:hypothetical protein